MILLSILIPSIPSRKPARDLLMSMLWLQRSQIRAEHLEMIDKHGGIEFLYDDDPAFNDGGPSIGKKRQSLLSRATGKYLCFLDDDETISPNYVEALYRLCIQGQDVCTFRAMAKLKEFWALVDMRLSYKINDQITPKHTVRRPPWHMCPVKTEFARLYEFSDKNNAEDFEWMEKVLMHCTTETHTDMILFSYNHGDHSEADKIPL